MTKTPLAPGEFKTRRAGSALIVLQRTDNGITTEAYTVTTTQGPTHRPDGWTGTYGTYAEARDAAEHARLAFRAHRTAEAIEARQAEIREALEDMRRRIARNYPINADERAELLAEDDALMNLGDLALHARFRADMIRRHAA